MWVAIEQFGLAEEAWFTELPGLEHGIPSHDTFGEVYVAIDTEQFALVFPAGLLTWPPSPKAK